MIENQLFRNGIDARLDTVSALKPLNDLLEHTCAVAHSLIQLSKPVPPNPVPKSSVLSPSLFLPLNHPIVSSPGSKKRMGGPLSQVASARPSWYTTAVLATLIFLIACCEPGRCDSITSAIVLKIRNIIVISELMGLTSVAILGSIGILMEEEVFEET